MLSERAFSENLRETIAHMQDQPVLIREVVKEVRVLASVIVKILTTANTSIELIQVPVIHEVASPSTSHFLSSSRAANQKLGQDENISESKFQLVTMLASERALSNKMEQERDMALERLRQAGVRLEQIESSGR